MQEYHNVKTVSKLRIITVLFFVLMMPMTASITFAYATTNQTVNSQESSFSFSDPVISLEHQLTKITLTESNSWTVIPGTPKLPIVVKTFQFEPGTIIEEVTCIPGETELISLSHQVQHNSAFQSISSDKTLGTSEPKTEIYHSSALYPSTSYTYQIGAGLSSDGSHVLFLSVHMFPVRYYPSQQLLSFTSNMSISISYKAPISPVQHIADQDKTDLIIITPNQFVSSLPFFVENKTRYGLDVEIQSVESIYSQYPGRDQQEKIKRFIYDAVSTKDCKYVLLLGDIHLLPIRTTDAYPWSPFHGSGLLTDLYYGDVYDASFQYSSWDADNDGTFGEVDFGDMQHMPFEADNIDNVDLYADVHIGRIPCSSAEELVPVLKKICYYEEITAYQNWFQSIILIGGDTFPLIKGSPLNVFEGEITNIKVAQQLPGFDKVYLWSSNHNLNTRTFNRAISKGAGFVSYAGHGFEHGWGTYRPNAIIDGNLIFYYTPYLRSISNEWKTPVVFMDACLTSKLDFNISDLIAYYGLKIRLANIFLRLEQTDYFSSFAWAFLKKEEGGAIATVGATRPAFTSVDKDGVYAGAGYLDVRFFHSYEEGVTVGEMLTQAQNDYINYVMKDFFTVEEYLLFGDPSMMVGGQP